MGNSSVAQGAPPPSRRTSEPAGAEAVVVDSSMTGAAPGWYYDPDDQAIYRWFDGERWTDHRTDVFVSHPPLDGDLHRAN